MHFEHVESHFCRGKITKAKKIKKKFSGQAHFFEKHEAGRFLFFIFQKTDEATFLFHGKLMRHLFFVHFKYKNVDILILTYE